MADYVPPPPPPEDEDEYIAPPPPPEEEDEYVPPPPPEDDYVPPPPPRDDDVVFPSRPASLPERPPKPAGGPPPKPPRPDGAPPPRPPKPSVPLEMMHGLVGSAAGRDQSGQLESPGGSPKALLRPGSSSRSASLSKAAVPDPDLGTYVQRRAELLELLEPLRPAIQKVFNVSATCSGLADVLGVGKELTELTEKIIRCNSKLSALITDAALRSHHLTYAEVFDSLNRKIFDLTTLHFLNQKDLMFKRLFLCCGDCLTTTGDMLKELPEKQEDSKPVHVDNDDISRTVKSLLEQAPAPKNLDDLPGVSKRYLPEVKDLYFKLHAKAAGVSHLHLRGAIARVGEAFFDITFDLCKIASAFKEGRNTKEEFSDSRKSFQGIVSAVQNAVRVATMQQLSEDIFNNALSELEYTKLHSAKKKKLKVGQSHPDPEPHMLTQDVEELITCLGSLHSGVAGNVRGFGRALGEVQSVASRMATASLEWAETIGGEPVLQQRAYRLIGSLNFASSLLIAVGYTVSARLGATLQQAMSVKLEEPKSVDIDDLLVHHCLNVELTCTVRAVVESIQDIVEVRAQQAGGRLAGLRNVDARVKEYYQPDKMNLDNVYVGVNDPKTVLYSEKPKSDGTPVIRGATLNRLVVALCTDSSGDSQFMGAFLTTYRSFTTPGEFFRLLLDVYEDIPREGGESDEAYGVRKKKTQARIIVIVKRWLDTCYFDLGVAFFLTFENFVQRMESDGWTQLASQLRSILQERSQSNIDLRSSHWVNSESGASFSQFRLPAQFLLEVDPRLIAETLTLIDFEVYRSIQPVELLNQAWNNPKYHHLAPNLRALCARFNAVSSWAASAVVWTANLKSRAKVVSALINLAVQLKKMNNFNTIMAILAGISHSAVHRLKFTASEVPKKDWKSFNDLQALMSSQQSFKRYREAIHQCNPPCIPYIGIYLTDLTFMEDGNPDNLGDLINFQKRTQLYGVIAEIAQYQMTPYAFEFRPDYATLLSVLPHNEDEEMYQLSLIREWRGAEKKDFR